MARVKQAEAVTGVAKVTLVHLSVRRVAQGPALPRLSQEAVLASRVKCCAIGEALGEALGWTLRRIQIADAHLAPTLHKLCCMLHRHLAALGVCKTRQPRMKQR